MSFKAVSRVWLLALDTSDSYSTSGVFADRQSLVEFWVQEIEDRLDGWAEDHGDWVRVLRDDEVQFIERWGQQYNEWWRPTEMDVLRLETGATELKRITDDDDQHQDDGGDRGEAGR